MIQGNSCSPGPCACTTAAHGCNCQQRDNQGASPYEAVPPPSSSAHTTTGGGRAVWRSWCWVRLTTNVGSSNASGSCDRDGVGEVVSVLPPQPRDDLVQQEGFASSGVPSEEHILPFQHHLLHCCLKGRTQQSRIVTRCHVSTKLSRATDESADMRALCALGLMVHPCTVPL